MTPQERIDSLANQRGGVATYPAPVKDAPEDTSRPEHRKPPMAWLNIKNGYDNRETFNATQRCESRVVAKLIAKSLGEQWRTEYPENGNVYIRIVHDSGFCLDFRLLWNNYRRYRIAPQDCRELRDSDIPQQITVSASKTPASITRDIHARILSKGAIGEYLRLKDVKKQNRVKDNVERLAMLQIARAMGSRLLAVQHNQYGNPKTNTLNLKACNVEVAQGYDDRYEFNIEIRNHATAIKLAEFLKDDLQ